MKHIFLLSVLTLVLSACSVEVITQPQAKVVVTPANPAVAPGGTVELKAALDNGSSAEFDWEVPVGSSFDPLTTDTIRYKAPTAGGTYTVKATATNVNATAGETQVIVDILLSGETKNATVDPPGSAAPPTLVTSSLGAGSTNYWTINVPADVAASGKALFIDVFPRVDVPLQLTVYNADRTPFASSTSNRFFAPGETAFATPQVLAPAAIVPEQSSTCLGACVIQSAKPGILFVKVTNPQTTAVTYDLYAFVANFADDGEDANDQLNSAISLSTTQLGAIEELNDIDYYSVAVSGRTFTFSTASEAGDLSLQATVIRGGQRLAPINSGGSVAVQQNDIIEVKSATNRASDYRLKTYTVDVQ